MTGVKLHSNLINQSQLLFPQISGKRELDRQPYLICNKNSSVIQPWASQSQQISTTPTHYVIFSERQPAFSVNMPRNVLILTRNSSNRVAVHLPHEHRRRTGCCLQFNAAAEEGSSARAQSRRVEMVKQCPFFAGAT